MTTRSSWMRWRPPNGWLPGRSSRLAEESLCASRTAKSKAASWLRACRTRSICFARTWVPDSLKYPHPPARFARRQVRPALRPAAQRGKFIRVPSGPAKAETPPGTIRIDRCEPDLACRYGSVTRLAQAPAMGPHPRHLPQHQQTREAQQGSPRFRCCSWKVVAAVRDRSAPIRSLRLDKNVVEYGHLGHCPAPVTTLPKQKNSEYSIESGMLLTVSVIPRTASSIVGAPEAVMTT